MSKEKYAETFDVDEDYFTGYFSNEKLTDIDDNYIAGIITEHDLTIMADQYDCYARSTQAAQKHR